MALLLLPQTTYNPEQASGASTAEINYRDSLSTVAEEPESPAPYVRGFDLRRRSAVRSKSLLRHEVKYLQDQAPAMPNNAKLSPESYGTPSLASDGGSFDEMYDVSDDEMYSEGPLEIEVRNDTESVTSEDCQPFQLEADDNKPVGFVRRPSRRGRSNIRVPSLVIPDVHHWPGMDKKQNSGVQPAQPVRIPVAQGVLSLLTANSIPSTSAAPSLDGSLSSEELQAYSPVPSTPGGLESSDEAGWDGCIQLGPDALETLNVLPSNDIPDQPIEVHEVHGPQHQMRELPKLDTSSKSGSAPSSAKPLTASAEGLALDIPSPSTFFGTLNAGSRATWCTPKSAHPPNTSIAERFYQPFGPRTPASPLPSRGLPTSLAEQFYGVPWSSSENRVVEQVVEFDAMSEGPSTAVPGTAKTAFLLSPKSSRFSSVREPLLELEDLESKVNVEDPYEVDEGYQHELMSIAEQNLDRTSSWLAAQTAYLSGITEERDDESVATESVKEPGKEPASLEISTPAEKTVRFSEVGVAVTSDPVPEPEETIKKESAFYRAFTTLKDESEPQDAFISRNERFARIRTERSFSKEEHIKNLAANYTLDQKLSEKAKKVDTPEIKDRAKFEKDREAMDQLLSSVWAVNAHKYLHNGRLLQSPAAIRLTTAPRVPAAANMSRRRILDLGGQPIGDWAWHCAREFPSAKVYTVLTKASRMNGAAKDTVFRGPHNHRQVAVTHLWKLPFGDAYFDVVSARSVYSLLKATKPPGSTSTDDEYDLCLAECMRVLKPGGYLEFQLIDSDLVNPGQLGNAMSVEFGYSLRTKGYDPAPTRSWIARLDKAGFTNTRRAWLFLPMGSPCVSRPPPVPAKDLPKPPTSQSNSSSNGTTTHRESGVFDEDDVPRDPGEAGSTDNVAPITGLLGSWLWERWMLKFKIENGKDTAEALEGVHAVFEEGRESGAGWRCLSGWARKPVRGHETPVAF